MTPDLPKGFAVLLLGLLSAPVSAAAQIRVTDELRHLAEIYGFTVSGLEQTATALGQAEGEALYPRLCRLLDGFDHVIVQGPTGGVERVIVLGEKTPFEPPPSLPAAASDSTEDGDIVVATKRRGNRHLVQTTLAGKDGSRIERPLHADTGPTIWSFPARSSPSSKSIGVHSESGRCRPPMGRSKHRSGSCRHSGWARPESSRCIRRFSRMKNSAATASSV